MRSLRNRNQSNITENINNKRIGRNKKKSEEERNLNEEMVKIKKKRKRKYLIHFILLFDLILLFY